MTGSAFARRRAMGCRGMLPAGLDGARSTPTRRSTATHTPVHVRHRQPDVSPAQLRLLHPPFVSKQLDAHYGKNHPSRGSFRDARAERQRERERKRAGYYHVDEYLREISASRSTRLRLRRLGPGILDVTDCGELFAAVGRTGLLRVSCLGECKTQGLQGLCKIN